VKRGAKRPKSTVSSGVELVLIILVAVGLAFGIQAWVVKPYRIPSGSMEPTLAVGQRVLVDRIGTHFGKPHVGEIAVFHPPEGAQQEACGSGTRIAPGGAPCSQPVAKEAGVNFIKRIGGGTGGTPPPTSPPPPATRSRSSKGTSSATASARPTPTSALVRAFRSAIFRWRSRFPPGTGS
jgi:hypothetical protein